MKKISEIFVICVFAVFITVAMVFTLSNRNDAYSYYENRLYSAMPKITKENIIEADFFNDLESFFCDHAAGRQTLLRAKTYADVYVFHRPVVNETVITEDALLPYNEYEKTDTKAIRRQAADMAEQQALLRDQIESYGGFYIYTAVPCQYACYADKYPSYLNNKSEFVETEIPAFTEEMEKHNVSFIDMMPIFTSGKWLPDGPGPVGDMTGKSQDLKRKDRKEALPYSSAVDNHYGLKGAYQTYRAIVDKINEETDYELTCPEGDEITFSEVETPYLGSRLRKLLGVVTWDERLLRADLRKDIPFTRVDSGVPVESSVYSDTAFEYGTVTYSFYMGGDMPETVISTNRPKLPSVLIFGDSFTNAVETMAYWSFDEMRSVDLRYYEDMSISEYINIFRPDIVVCIRDYSALLSTDGNGTLFG